MSVRLEIEWTNGHMPELFVAKQVYADIACAHSSVADWLEHLGIEKGLVTISFVENGFVLSRVVVDADAGNSVGNVGTP